MPAVVDGSFDRAESLVLSEDGTQRATGDVQEGKLGREYWLCEGWQQCSKLGYNDKQNNVSTDSSRRPDLCYSQLTLFPDPPYG